MKSIKELREQYQVITEKEDKEQRKLTALVRAGLFDAKKLPMLKRALEKGVDKMTPAEKKILIDLLDSLMNQVVSNEPVYMKVKRNVQSVDEEIIAEAVKKPLTVTDIPTIVILKRKAVRVYPGGHQVGLYYSQQIDKYVTIPFGEAGISDLSEDTIDEATTMRTQSVNTNRVRRRRDDYDDEMSKAINTKYDKLSINKRKMLTPTKVALHTAMRGGNASQVATGAILAALLRSTQGKIDKTKKLQKLDAFDVKRKAQNQNAKERKNKKLQAIDKYRAKLKAVKAASKVVSPAIAGTLQSKIRPITQKKTISEKAAIKEAVLLKLMERQQIDEFAPLIGAAIATGARVAAPLIARGAVAAGSRLAAGAASAGRAARGLGQKLLNKLKGKRGGSLNKGKKGRGKKGKRGNLFDLDVNTGGSGDSSLGSATPNFDRSKFAKSIESPFSSQLQTQKVGPQYKTTSDAYNDPATARRLQKQFYSQQQQQNESTKVDLDGNLFEINNNIAEKLINVYESLNNNNKQKMVDMLMNEETQNKILEFVRRY